MPKTYPTPCTKEEIESIIQAASDNPFYYALFMVAKTTGRRLGEYYGIPVKEVVGKEEYINNQGQKRFRSIKKATDKLVGGVQVKDINFETGVMKTQILKKRKYDTKEALLRPDVALMLKQYIRGRNLKDDDYVFRDVSYRQIQNAITSYAKKAGINHAVSFHNFRHYFITELVKKGWHYDQISKLTGHSTPQTIVSYDHAVASDIRDKAMIDIANI